MRQYTITPISIYSNMIKIIFSVYRVLMKIIFSIFYFFFFLQIEKGNLAFYLRSSDRGVSSNVCSRLSGSSVADMGFEAFIFLMENMYVQNLMAWYITNSRDSYGH